MYPACNDTASTLFDSSFFGGWGASHSFRGACLLVVMVGAEKQRAVPR